MARTVSRPDTGKYNRPATIQKPAPRVEDGQGGNSATGQWVTVRGGTPPLMIALNAAMIGHGVKRSFQYGQQYPEANHWAEMHYSSTAIDASMTLLVDGRRFQILGAIDHQLAHVTTILALVEYQAKGSK